MLAQIIAWKELGQTVLYSLAAGIGLALVFSLAVWGAARYTDFGSSERPIAATGAAALALLAAAVTVGAVVFGIVVMAQK
ncbi:MAG: hypothetical protein U0R52_08605 [Solirubrobacterales bacterium]